MTHACKLFITAGRVEVKVMGNIHYAIAVLTSPCVACFTDFLRRQLQHFILSQVHLPPPSFCYYAARTPSPSLSSSYPTSYHLHLGPAKLSCVSSHTPPSHMDTNHPSSSVPISSFHGNLWKLSRGISAVPGVKSDGRELLILSRV